jgi:hypothetical protein
MKGIHVPQQSSNHHQRAQKPEMSQPRPPINFCLYYYYLPTAALLINLKNIDIKLSLSTNQSK